MDAAVKLTGYFAGSLFSGQELYGNRGLAAEISRVSQGTVQMDIPQDLATQESGDGQGTRAADYLGMLQRDFVFANMNGPELDSGTVAEYVVASMLGMPRVQYRSDFRNVGDVPTDFAHTVTVGKTAAVPYNLMLGHDESAFVYVNSIALYKSASSLEKFLEQLAIAAVRGIAVAFDQTQIAQPPDYDSQEVSLVRYLRLDEAVVRAILQQKKSRHIGDGYRSAVRRLNALKLD